jgi:hypothetical protein
MKKILILFALSLISYIVYILFGAVIIRVPMLSDYTLSRIFIIPGYHIHLILPTILIYSMIRGKNYQKSKVVQNTIWCFSIYFFLLVIFTTKLFPLEDIWEFVIWMIGMILFLVFHVLFMTYFLSHRQK